MVTLYDLLSFAMVSDSAAARLAVRLRQRVPPWAVSRHGPCGMGLSELIPMAIDSLSTLPGSVALRGQDSLGRNPK